MRQRIAALVLAGVCLAATTCGSGSSQTTATPTSTTPPPVPVAVGALQGLLLSPTQMNTDLVATAMAVGTKRMFMYDNSTTVSAPDCRAVQEPAVSSAYAGSHWIALQGNTIQEAGRGWTHLVDQAVVVFLSAKDAAAFFTAATQRWQACSNGQYRITRPGEPAQAWQVGPVTDTDGILSATLTSGSPDGGGCRRVLTVANNVAIDIGVCSADPGDAAQSVARQIAGKVPTK